MALPPPRIFASHACNSWLLCLHISLSLSLPPSVYLSRVQLLEVHVDKAQQGRRETETPEGKEARELLGLALCNRSVARFRLGDYYSGMVSTVYPALDVLVGALRSRYLCAR